MAIIGIALSGLRRHDPAAPGGYAERDLATELVALMRLAFGSTLHLGGVDAVELALVVALLEIEPFGQGEQLLGLRLHGRIYARCRG